MQAIMSAQRFMMRTTGSETGGAHFSRPPTARSSGSQPLSPWRRWLQGSTQQQSARGINWVCLPQVSAVSGKSGSTSDQEMGGRELTKSKRRELHFSMLLEESLWHTTREHLGSWQNGTAHKALKEIYVIL